MTDMTLAPRRRPLWGLFLMPVLLLIAAVAWSAFWFYAASQVEVKADAWRAQEAKSGRVYDCAKRTVAGFPFRLEVRCDGASVSLISQTAGQAAARDAGHGQSRRNPGGRADLRSKIADRGIYRACDDLRFARVSFDAGELEQGSLQRGGIAGRSAARLHRVRRPDRSTASMDRCRRRWRARGMSSCTAVLRKLAARSSRDRNRAEDRGGSVQERASAACPAVRCRRADDAERPERFFAKTMARPVSRTAGRRRTCRDRAIAYPAGRSDRGRRRHARAQRARASRRRIADDGCRHREGDPGARHRENAG